MDSPAYSSSSTVYLQSSNYPNLQINNTTSSSQHKPLTLSIQPLKSTSKSLYIAPVSNSTQYTNLSKSENHSSNYYNTCYENLPHMNPMQGPNTNEYFGHGTYNSESYQDNENVQSVKFNDIIETPSDPYDNTTGEQRFCGGYGEWGHVISHTERSILPDLKPYPFPDDIKNQADVIYNKMRYQVRRGKIRYQMLFFCVYYAHVELGRDVNPIQLGAQFGLTQGEVQRCDSLFSPLQTGYRPPSINTSPLGYLPDYCQNMDLSQEAIDEIMKMSAIILRKDPTLYQENPQTVAAGLLRYFTVTNGITTDDPQKITRVTNRSTVTIDGMFRRIATIDNN
jgi:hypothetical protein